MAGLSKKDVKQLLADLESQGFEIRRSRKNYPMIWKNGRFVTKMAQTPGDARSLKNSIARCKRAGYQKGEKGMVDDQKKDTGEGDAYSKMLMDAGDISADMAAIILGMRSNLLEGGMSPEAADAGALQFQNYLLTTGADAHRASLQPKRGGIFG